MDLRSSESEEFASFSDHLLSDLEAPREQQLSLRTHSRSSDDPGRAGPSSERGAEAVRPRKRRPRISYDTMTEDEKYVHIRDINNVASRTYRHRHRQTVTKLQSEEKALLEKNRALRAKEKALQELKNHMQSLEGFVKRKVSDPHDPAK